MRDYARATLMQISKPALVLAGLLLASAGAAADNGKHGLSAFGELKYPADFKHFEWVNPDAPKGGRMSMIGTAALTTFDSFNTFILKGDAAQGLGHLFDLLMTRALDESDAVYGLVARSAEVASDGSSVTFRLRPEAKFADGSALTADDVIFTFEYSQGEGPPALPRDAQGCRQGRGAGSHTVRYTFTGTETRDLPLVVAGLPILPKAYYATREFDQTTLEPPLGSGPYKIGEFRQGTFVSYKRREDYWGKDLPVNRGRYNFDELRYEYYRDRTAALESFKAGAFDLREEFTARDWATAYDIPAVKDGRMLRLVAARRQPFRRARIFPQHPPAEAGRHTRAQGARLCLRFRVDQQEHLLRPLHAHRELLRELRHEGHGQAEPGRAGAARAVPRRNCRARYSRSPTSRRFRTAPARTASCCARLGGCSTRPAGT